MQRILILCILLLRVDAFVAAQTESEQAGDSSLSAAIEIIQDSSANRVILVNDRSLSKDISYFFHSADPSKQQLVDLLARKNIQSQIELSNEQRRQIHQLRQEMNSGLATIAKNFDHRNDPKYADALRDQFYATYQEEVAKFRQDINQKVKDTLVTQQLDLIKSLQFNQSVQIYGFAKTLSRAPYSTQLKTTKEQSQKLLKIKQEAEAEIKKAIDRIRQKAKGKMLKELDSAQRDQIKKLQGKSAKSLPGKL